MDRQWYYKSEGISIGSFGVCILRQQRSVGFVLFVLRLRGRLEATDINKICHRLAMLSFVCCFTTYLSLPTDFHFIFTCS
jgi:hypothetical protein